MEVAHANAGRLASTWRGNCHRKGVAGCHWVVDGSSDLPGPDQMSTSLAYVFSPFHYRRLVISFDESSDYICIDKRPYPKVSRRFLIHKPAEYSSPPHQFYKLDSEMFGCKCQALDCCLLWTKGNSRNIPTCPILLVTFVVIYLSWYDGDYLWIVLDVSFITNSMVWKSQLSQYRDNCHRRIILDKTVTDKNIYKNYVCCCLAHVDIYIILYMSQGRVFIDHDCILL